MDPQELARIESLRRKVGELLFSEKELAKKLMILKQHNFLGELPFEARIQEQIEASCYRNFLLTNLKDDLKSRHREFLERERVQHLSS